MEDREWTDAGTRILGRQTYHFAKKGYVAERAREREVSGQEQKLAPAVPERSRVDASHGR